MDERRDSSDDTPAAVAGVVSSADADEEDRRAGRSLVIALLLAFLVAVGVTNANGATNPSSGAPTGARALSGPCRVPDDVAAALSAAETPWDYMRVLGYPEHAIGNVLNERAEAVMDEHANGEVRWVPAANDGVFADDAQLVLIMGEDGKTEEITDTQQVMALLDMEAICPSGTIIVALPTVS